MLLWFATGAGKEDPGTAAPVHVHVTSAYFDFCSSSDASFSAAANASDALYLHVGDYADALPVRLGDRIDRPPVRHADIEAIVNALCRCQVRPTPAHLTHDRRTGRRRPASRAIPKVTEVSGLLEEVAQEVRSLITTATAAITNIRARVRRDEAVELDVAYVIRQSLDLVEGAVLGFRL